VAAFHRDDVVPKPHPGGLGSATDERIDIVKAILRLALAASALGIGFSFAAGAEHHENVEGMDMYFDGNTTTGEFPGTLQCIKGDDGASCREGHAVLVTLQGSVSLIVPKVVAAAVKANLGKQVVVNGMFYPDIDTIFVANVVAK